jgi:dihydroorotate dehydrogenase
MLKKFVNKFPRLILKLPNGDINKTLEYYRIGKKCGIKCFHIGNTIKTDKGGLSGQFVKRMSISAIKYIRKEDKDSIIIGGGGIYSAKDVAEYKEAGANVFSLCTVFWTAPWKIWEIKKEIYKTNNNEK